MNVKNNFTTAIITTPRPALTSRLSITSRELKTYRLALELIRLVSISDLETNNQTNKYKYTHTHKIEHTATLSISRGLCRQFSTVFTLQ